MKKSISTTVTKIAITADISAAQAQPVEGVAAVDTPRYHAVVGLDVGDRQSHYCVLALEGSVGAEGAVKTTEAALRVLFEGKGHAHRPGSGHAFTLDASLVERAGP